MALNVQFGGLFFKLFGGIFKKEKSSNIGYFDVWKLQSWEIIIETEFSRFAKNGGFFKNVGRFLQN